MANPIPYPRKQGEGIFLVYDLAVPDQAGRKPPIRFPGMPAPPDDRTIGRTRNLLLGLLGIYVAWALVRSLVGAVSGPVRVPIFVWLFNAAYVGVFAALLGLTVKRVLWGVYVVACLAAVMALLTFCSASAVIIGVMPNARTMLVFQTSEFLLCLSIAILGFKYGDQLRTSEAVRLAREAAESDIEG